MNTTSRVALLVDKALSGELGDEELRDLAGVVEREDRAAEYVRQLLVVEAALRARAVAPDVSAEVLQKLKERERRQQSETIDVVMSHVRRAAVPSKRRPLRKAAIAASCFGALAAIAYAAIDRMASQNQETVIGAGPSAPLHERAEPPKIHNVDPATTPDPNGYIWRPETRAPDAPTEPASLFAHDFEDGLLPEAFEQGLVIAAPPGTPSRYVAEGTFNPWAPNRSSIILDKGGSLFTYRPSLVLRFRYLLQGERDGIRVQIFNLDQRQNYQWTHPAPVRGTWSSVSIPLRDFYPVLDRSATLSSGDRIQNVHIMGGAFLAKPLLIDDVSLGVPP